MCELEGLSVSNPEAGPREGGGVLAVRLAQGRGHLAGDGDELHGGLRCKHTNKGGASEPPKISNERVCVLGVEWVLETPLGVLQHGPRPAEQADRRPCHRLHLHQLRRWMPRRSY